jgi:trehalose 6-phosphate phosphatase
MVLSGLLKVSPPVLDLKRDALFLDLDGTVVEIADSPSDVRLEPGMRAVLCAWGERGALAVLTGRAVADADRILNGAIGAIAGLHGLESRLSPQHWSRRGGEHAGVRELAQRFAEEIASGALNARLEDKGASFALHYRHAPEQEARVVRAAEAAAEVHGLRALKGKMVVEILPSGAAKGDALREFMEIAPFAGRRPVAVGDDVTDESAFEAANALGGLSVLVGPARATAAQARLDSVTAVGDWLSRALEGVR